MPAFSGKILFVNKTPPDPLTEVLMEALARDREADRFDLFEPDPDYPDLIDRIFKADRVVSWW